MDALLWLKDLVQKILPEWEVSTPDANEAGNIMYQVIKSCDRSDLGLQIQTVTIPTYYMKLRY
jgi:hypothetical protein